MGQKLQDNQPNAGAVPHKENLEAVKACEGLVKELITVAGLKERNLSLSL